jgi:hypothetical protein
MGIVVSVPKVCVKTSPEQMLLRKKVTGSEAPLWKVRLMTELKHHFKHFFAVGFHSRFHERTLNPIGHYRSDLL